MGLSVLLFSNLFDFLLNSQRAYLFAFIFGLMLASSFIPLKKVKEVKVVDYIIGVIVFLFIFILLGQNPALPKENPALLLLIGGGVLASSAMALPVRKLPSAGCLPDLSLLSRRSCRRYHLSQGLKHQFTMRSPISLLYGKQYCALKRATHLGALI